MISEKIERLVEESIQDIYLKAKGFFFGKYFKDFTEEEFNLILDIISDWYYFNIGLDHLFKKKRYSEVFKKLKKELVIPRRLYRGLTFSTKREREQFIKNLKNGSIVRKDNPYESWSASKIIAKQFIPGGKYYYNSRFGLIMEINPSDFKEDIVFSLSSIINNEKDRKDFYQKVVRRHAKHLHEGVDSKSIKKYVNKFDLFSEIHGTVYALTEEEYILKTLTKNLTKIKFTRIDI